MSLLEKKIKKYIEKYKVFRPYLKAYLKKFGYIKGFLKLTKITIREGLTSLYRYLVTSEFNIEIEPTCEIVSLKDADQYLYVILAPNYVSYSAGVYCLYKLCHDLNEKGYPTAMYGTEITPPHLNTPLIISKKIINRLKNKNNTWVIYPETIPGNPLGFKNVARWVLNRPGLLGGDKVYDSGEKIFVYSNVYAPYVQNKIHGKLFMTTFDHSLFYPPKKEDSERERHLACYYVGKSTFKTGYFNLAETFEITRAIPAKKELGKIFRTAKVLYCFDNSTALTYEAIACGCPVQIIPDGTQKWEDYEKLELGTTGIFWNKPAEKLSYDDVNSLINKIKSIEVNYNIELDHFIQSTALS